jgi:hypothetical protein
VGLQLVSSLSLLRTVVHTDLATVAADPMLRWIPTIWFLALSQTLAGVGSPAIAALAWRAVMATTLTTAGALLLFASTHRRLMRLALESRESVSRRRGWRTTLMAGVLRLADRGPVPRAVSAFAIQTITRSRPHRLLLATYVGLAGALMVSETGPLLWRDRLAALRQPHVELLAVPFVLQFCVLLGARLALAIPVEPRANWIFRLDEPGDRLAVVNSVRDLLLITIVVPIAIAATLTAWLLWGAWLAVMQLTSGMVMGWLLVEILLVGFRKIPFACTYYPGRSRMRTVWPFYLLALIGYATGTAGAERALASHPAAYGAAVLLIAATTAALARHRAQRLAEPFGLRFEEEDPDALFPGFDFRTSSKTQSASFATPTRYSQSRRRDAGTTGHMAASSTDRRAAVPPYPSWRCIGSILLNDGPGENATGWSIAVRIMKKNHRR